MYHGVDSNENQTFNRRFFGVRSFERQMQYLRRHYHIVPLGEFFARTHSRRQRTVAITFDDGYQNVYKYAFPVLDRLNVPATFFVTGLNATDAQILWADLYDIGRSFMNTPFAFGDEWFTHNRNDGHYYAASNCRFDTYYNKDSRPGLAKQMELENVFSEQLCQLRSTSKYDDYWKLMSDEEIAHVARSRNVSIGSHGFFHNALGSLALDDARAELVASKEYLERVTGRVIDTIGYPGGAYTRAIVDAAEEIGFKYQCAVQYLYEADDADFRLLDRIGFYPSDCRRRPSRIIAKYFQPNAR